MIHQLRPDVIINDRCGLPGDYKSPEQHIGDFDLERDWESNMTFTGFWAWHGYQTKVIPFEECLTRLVRCAGGNGNLLMNIGPMPTGEIDTREADRLKRIGEWLKIHGESIYGTTGGPYKPGDYGVSTRKEPCGLPARPEVAGVRPDQPASHPGQPEIRQTAFRRKSRCQTGRWTPAGFRRRCRPRSGGYRRGTGI